MKPLSFKHDSHRTDQFPRFTISFRTQRRAIVRLTQLLKPIPTLPALKLKHGHWNPLLPLRKIQHQTSSIEHRASSIEYRASSIEHQVSSIEHRASSIEYRASVNQSVDQTMIRTSFNPLLKNNPFPRLYNTQ
jgi:hypothetical protein